MKAQVAIEYLVIVSFALMVLIPYILYLKDVSQNYSENNKLVIAKNSVDKLGQVADWVYSQGEGAKTKIDILIPEGVDEIILTDHIINWKVRTSSGVSDIYYTTVANITGSIPTSSGYVNLVVQAIKDGVNVSAG